MRCPSLADLPPPPPGKVGWPWTIDSLRLPDAMPAGRAWPRVSIVTPSYNQGRYIEETIRSTLLQGYPDLEYIVMDGGSSDGALDIIRKYGAWLAHWRTGPDGGQAAAINGGFARASGEILAWVNSDDGYLPNAFGLVAAATAASSSALVVGDHVVFDGAARAYENAGPIRSRYLYRGGLIAQHAAFWTRALHEPLDASLLCAMDFDLWARIVPKAEKIIRLPRALAYCNVHQEQKTRSDKWKAAWKSDDSIIARKYPRLTPKSRIGRKVLDVLYDCEARFDAALRETTDRAEVEAWFR